MSYLYADPRFPDELQRQLHEELQTHGAEAAEFFVSGFADPKFRAELWKAITRVAFNDEQPLVWSPDSPVLMGDWWTLDLFCEMIDAAIADLYDSVGMGAGPDQEWFKSTLLELCFRKASILVPGFPGDDKPRLNRHFEIGAEAARFAINFGKENGGRAGMLAHCVCALGCHQFGLEQASAALTSFELAIEYAELEASKAKAGTQDDAEARVYLACYRAFRGLAQAVTGNPDGTREFSEARRKMQAISYETYDDSNDDEYIDVENDIDLSVITLDYWARVKGIERTQTESP